MTDPQEIQAQFALSVPPCSRSLGLLQNNLWAETVSGPEPGGRIARKTASFAAILTARCPEVALEAVELGSMARGIEWAGIEWAGIAPTCHPERSEGPCSGTARGRQSRSLAPLGMTGKRSGSARMRSGSARMRSGAASMRSGPPTSARVEGASAPVDPLSTRVYRRHVQSCDGSVAARRLPVQIVCHVRRSQRATTRLSILAFPQRRPRP
jgi:hypothetical protein